LSEAHQHTNPDLHGIAAQRLQQDLIDIIAVAGGEVGHFHHHPGVLEHNPETLGAFHSLPGVVGCGVKFILPEELFAEIARAPLGTKTGKKRIP